MDRTPEDWLKFLATRLDQRYLDQREKVKAPYPGTVYPGITVLRDYAHGRPKLPEMGRNIKESWEKFQRKARRNLGGLAINSLLSRVRYNGVRIGTSNDSEAVQVARRVLRDNRAPLQFALAIRDMVETRWGYLVVGQGADGHAVITRERPEQFIAYTDPTRPWKVLAALKVWRGDDDGKDHARIWAAGVSQTFERPVTSASGTVRSGAWSEDWKVDADPEIYDGDPPIIALELEEALLEPHLDSIDAIVLAKLNRLVIAAMQAFRQRALKKVQTGDGDAGDLEVQDADGNDVDVQKAFVPAPGAMWDLPEGVDIWESKETSLDPLINGEKRDAEDFAAETETPVSVFLPAGQNQSAEGAASAKEAQVSKARAMADAISPALAVLVVYALRVERVQLAADETVEILWVPPEHVSLTEKYSAAAQAKAAGRSRRGIMRDILGMSPDQIAEEERDLSDEALWDSVVLGGTGGPATVA